MKKRKIDNNVNLKEIIDTIFFIIMDLCIINLEEYFKMIEKKIK